MSKAIAILVLTLFDGSGGTLEVKRVYPNMPYCETIAQASEAEFGANFKSAECEPLEKFLAARKEKLRLSTSD